MSWHPYTGRYENMQYRYCGKSGLRLPALSLGLWHSFGHVQALDSQRALLRKAFDLGITHFDLANIYGPPPGSAEENVGRLLREDFAGDRDELIISTKAGYDMWPGPYGSGGSRKYLLASLDQSLKRMGVEYVDIFYSHRVDENTPMEETAAALAHAVQSGKALYVGISSYSTERTTAMAELLREWKIPLLIHQPSYNLLNRWVDKTGGRAGEKRNGLYRLYPAGAGPADREIPERYSGRFTYAARREKSTRPDGENADRSQPEQPSSAERDGARARADDGADGAKLAVERYTCNVGADRREPPGATGRERSGAE